MGTEEFNAGAGDGEGRGERCNPAMDQNFIHAKATGISSGLMARIQTLPFILRERFHTVEGAN